MLISSPCINEYSTDTSTQRSEDNNKKFLQVKLVVKTEENRKYTLKLKRRKQLNATGVNNYSQTG